jgi:hypothetical protein
METNTMVGYTDTKEKDLHSILMESNLYLELTLAERYLLLKHIVEFYNSNNVCVPANKEKGSVTHES